MKKALVLAYFFPPIGGGGVQRAVKFTRYLPDFDYEPVIVSGHGGYSTAKLGSDETLAHELSHDLVVHRIPTPEPPPPTLTRARLERWLRIESAWKRWWVSGAVAAGATAENVDVIFATMSPFESITKPVLCALPEPCWGTPNGPSLPLPEDEVVTVISTTLRAERR